MHLILMVFIPQAWYFPDL